MHLKAHKVVQQGCFFFHSSLSTHDQSSLNTDLLFYALCIHQVKILVFGNYQTCPVPTSVLLTTLMNIKETNTTYLYSIQYTSAEDVHASIDLIRYKRLWLFYKSLDLSRLIINYHTIFGRLFHFGDLGRNKQRFNTQTQILTNMHFSS